MPAARPSISVVMITYEGARWVRAQAASIAAQTRRPDEVIVADDGSVDDTVARATEALTPLGDRVRVLDPGARLGVSRNLERAMQAATGDIIVFADQDDVWLPHRLDAVERWATEETAGGCFTDGWIIDAGGQRTGDRLWARAGFDTRSRSRWPRDPLAVLLRRPVVTGATMAVRRDTLDLLLPIPRSGWHDYSISLLLAATAGLTALPEPLVEYRLHDANAVGLTRQTARVRPSPADRRANLRDQQAQFDALRGRLVARGAARAAARLQAKAAVLGTRAALPDGRGRRLLPITRLLATGGYHRYARGLMSAAHDFA